MAPIPRSQDGHIGLARLQVDVQSWSPPSWLLATSTLASVVVLVTLILLILTCACGGGDSDSEKERRRRKVPRQPHGASPDQHSRIRDRFGRSRKDKRRGEKRETNVTDPKKEGFKKGRDKHDRGHHDDNKHPERRRHDSPNARAHHDHTKDGRGKKDVEMEKLGQPNLKKVCKKASRKVKWSTSNLESLDQIEKERIAKAATAVGGIPASPGAHLAPVAPAAPTATPDLPISPEFAVDVGKAAPVKKATIAEATSGLSVPPSLHAPDDSAVPSVPVKTQAADAAPARKTYVDPAPPKKMQADAAPPKKMINAQDRDHGGAKVVRSFIL